MKITVVGGGSRNFKKDSCIAKLAINLILVLPTLKKYILCAQKSQSLRTTDLDHPCNILSSRVFL